MGTQGDHLKKSGSQKSAKNGKKQIKHDPQAESARAKFGREKG